MRSGLGVYEEASVLPDFLSKIRFAEQSVGGEANSSLP